MGKGNMIYQSCYVYMYIVVYRLHVELYWQSVEPQGSNHGCPGVVQSSKPHIIEGSALQLSVAIDPPHLQGQRCYILGLYTSCQCTNSTKHPRCHQDKQQYVLGHYPDNLCKMTLCSSQISGNALVWTLLSRVLKSTRTRVHTEDARICHLPLEQLPFGFMSACKITQDIYYQIYLRFWSLT